MEKPTLPPIIDTTNYEESVTHLQTVLHKEKECEKTCVAYLKSINKFFATLDDLSILLNQTKQKCEGDGDLLVNIRNKVLQNLVELEKSRCDNELKINSFRKSQIQEDFFQIESSLTSKMKTSIFPSSSQLSKSDERISILQTNEFSTHPENSKNITKRETSKPHKKSEKAKADAHDISPTKKDIEKYSKTAKSESEDKSTILEDDEGDLLEMETSGFKRLSNDTYTVNPFALDSLTENAQSMTSDDMLTIEEKAQIFAWSGRSVGKMVYDYDKTPSRVCSSLFIKAILGCNGLVVVVSVEDSVFGVCLYEKVLRTSTNVDDPKSFVFTLHENGIDKRKKFLIKKENSKHAFYIGAINSMAFFNVGKGDIRVSANREKKVICDCKQNAFDYGGSTKNIVGDVNDNKTVVPLKRFVVYKLEMK
ncbi:hypothetical protein EIN_508670 [Entamoeba invadens IP1]|uniref:TLDc domain-containing protein n=1 Tax=Entamoeba invadens IP1 TaxID=370355 RepID=A0A0A1UFQ6_ENTIV|nr:hypothetical protein EIN_508670 [Entamoeba invadens IP1]ELP92866.1 hypothetical protein EIN_508670 [Entamoeba invadens IP1]|eukprot:XP_004259637.1 hypothetical protein EIN_508670 [Entamoeba invadens IP1]